MINTNKILIVMIVACLAMPFVSYQQPVKADISMSNVYAQYHLNSSAGTNALDSSGNWRNGTTSGAPTWVAGKLNNCLSFNGASQHINCSDIASFERTDSFSFEFWVNTSFTAATQQIISRMDDIIYKGYEIYLTAGNVVNVVLINSVTNYIHVRTNTTMMLTNWSHVVVTYDGSNDWTGIKVYVNGTSQPLAMVKNNLAGTIIISTQSLLIGKSDTLNYWFNGKLDEIVIYNKVLSQSEVDFRYNSSYGRETMSSGSYLPTGPTTPSSDFFYPTDLSTNVDILPIAIARINTTGSNYTANWYWDDTGTSSYKYFGTNSSIPKSWYDTKWHKRMWITINNAYISADCSNVPLGLHLNATVAANCTANGSDLRFIATDNNTNFSYEIELINSTDIYVWILFPTVYTAVPTGFWVYFNNTAAVNSVQNPNNVWQDYGGVYHMNETGFLWDSSGNSISSPVHNNSIDYFGTKTNLPSINKSGMFGNATWFDGTGYNFGSIFGQSGGDVSIEGWLTVNVLWGHSIAAGAPSLVGTMTKVGEGGGYSLSFNDEPSGMFWIVGNLGSLHAQVTSNFTNPTHFQYFWGAIYEPPALNIANFSCGNYVYKSASSATDPGNFYYADGTFVIGRNLTGTIDEVRVVSGGTATQARTQFTDARRNATYLNLNQTDFFHQNVSQDIGTYTYNATYYQYCSNVTKQSTSYQMMINSTDYYSGESSADAITFTTLTVNPPTAPTALKYNTTCINVTWTNFTAPAGCTGNISALVKYSDTGYPANIGAGYTLYNGSAFNNASLKNCTIDTPYYFSLWTVYEKYGLILYSASYATASEMTTGGLFNVTIRWECNQTLVTHTELLGNATIIMKYWNGQTILVYDNITSNHFQINTTITPDVITLIFNNMSRSITPWPGQLDVTFYVCCEEECKYCGANNYTDYQFIYTFSFVDQTPVQTFLTSNTTKFYIYLYNSTGIRFYIDQNYLSVSQTVVSTLEYGKVYYCGIECDNSNISFLGPFTPLTNLNIQVIIPPEGITIYNIYSFVNVSSSNSSQGIWVNYTDWSFGTNSVTVTFYNYSNSSHPEVKNYSFATNSNNNQWLVGDGANLNSVYFVTVEINHDYFTKNQTMKFSIFGWSFSPKYYADWINGVFISVLGICPLSPVSWTQMITFIVFFLCLISFGPLYQEIGVVFASIILIVMEAVVLDDIAIRGLVIAFAIFSIIFAMIVYIRRKKNEPY